MAGVVIATMVMTMILMMITTIIITLPPLHREEEMEKLPHT